MFNSKFLNILLAICLIFELVDALKLKNKKDKEHCPPAYSTCNLGKEGFINVHIVPHTHDDVGWLKTVDQYFYGSNKREQDATVQYVLDSVINELQKDPNRRFVYVEIAYFYRWWNEQNNETKSIVRDLVNQNRLEFVIGAWCMNDEATTYYNDIIDQQTLGLQFILKEFGECARPRSAWQIDPFGHSREQASLFAQFGFDGLFLGRADYQDIDNRGTLKTREMLWQASQNLGKNSQLFTGILPNGYNPPDGFCFDQYCGDDPIMDDPNLEDNNVIEKVDLFINQTLEQAGNYKTSNLINTMGSDFQYSNAHMWFKNLDKLIYYVNQRQSNGSKVNIFYSTTACYLYSLNQANEKWTTKYDDFFPYAHRPHSFWTGYFTSRAALKNYVRRTNNVLQSVRHLVAFADMYDDATKDSIGFLERAMGVVQHHDGVSGTERQHVANDYAKRLSIGVDMAIDVVNRALNTLNVLHENVYFCSLLNISQCHTIESSGVSNSFTVLLYNPLPRAINYWVNLPVVHSAYDVTYYGQEIYIDSECSPIYSDTKSIPERNSTAQYNLVFLSYIEPLTVGRYTAQIHNAKMKKTFKNNYQESNNLKYIKNKDSSFNFSNEYLNLGFDSNGNLVQIVRNSIKPVTIVSQSYCIYQSMPGNNSEPQFQASGAYIFRPDQNTNINCIKVSSFSVYQGKQFNEIHQVFNEYISQTIRLYAYSNNFEINWQVGPINIDDQIGKEIAIKFDTDLVSNGVFYTDANGREILKRVRDYRPTWKLEQTEPISGNYYPVNSRIFIRDEIENKKFKQKLINDENSRQFTIVTDRSQGGSSIKDGSIELMLHRRVLYDDSLGVSEPMNETGSDGKGLVVKGNLQLMLDTTENSSRLHRELAHRMNNQPLILFTPDIQEPKTEETFLTNNSPKPSLPPNLHLLTLIEESSNTKIVRIEHFYELGEDVELSQPVTVDLNKFFMPYFNITAYDELALGANMGIDELNERLNWYSEDKHEFSSFETKDPASTKESFEFTFQPMQIRTFRFYL